MLIIVAIFKKKIEFLLRAIEKNESRKYGLRQLTVTH